MDREKQIKFLEEALEKEIQARLVVEVDYRLLTRSAMRVKNINDPLLAKQTQYKELKELHDGRIYFVRELLEEVRNDKFMV